MHAAFSWQAGEGASTSVRWRTQIYVDYGRKRPDSRNHVRRIMGYVCRECSLKLFRMRERLPFEIKFP